MILLKCVSCESKDGRFICVFHPVIERSINPQNDYVFKTEDVEIKVETDVSPVVGEVFELDLTGVWNTQGTSGPGKEARRCINGLIHSKFKDQLACLSSVRREVEIHLSGNKR